ncbi:Dopey, N-terminal-domain-containing protein [Desarmillaria tabescens]|uniref:Dopey, N-terminal-domain-containing protein n=1 Tax=Armillaria tabescens TaxID=1929756 RepID=A0AA39NII6_ARMTA|nr:Dopey, N-terminal-domain-containing protein [Desarmillaria tabescens]KAK0466281.1 Dopey, N-terminal-domain-containing protein [Desarmillaria tabescens]
MASTDSTEAGTAPKKGSTWISERTSERAAAQQAYESDPKYKKYTQQVEKCLNSFDNVHEWADCIAFLKQLLKTFQSYMQFKEIPRKLIVAKRLSQCLNPALPTGVHQRALDVYAHILAVLGSEGLRRDLALWSSGLFPFFEYAATSVKPTLLNLYDTHYLPLQGGLRPVMKSFIIALLPGLEEETGEFFEKVLSLLDRLSGAVSMSFFFQNIWLVMLTTPAARGTSLNLLSRRLPRLMDDEDILSIIGRDIGLMIRAFAAALEDENLLVRRGALDLLLQSMRLDSAALHKAQGEDRTILMRAAVSVVLRRDLSLNRRLYTWLLGPDEKPDHQITYLRTNALNLLSSTLKEEMTSPSSEYSESRPFKIFISLLDKWEIGAPLTDVLVFDSFKALKALVLASTDSSEDVTMTASTLYEAVEPGIIWKQLLQAVFDEIIKDEEKCEAISMVQFILKTFSQDEEIQTIHLPVIFAAIVDLLHFRLSTTESPPLSITTKETLSLLETILHQVPHVALMQRPEASEGDTSARDSQRPYIFACTVYGIGPLAIEPAPSSRSFRIPFASSFESLVSLSSIFSHALVSAADKVVALREALCQTLLLLDTLVGRLGTSTIKVTWHPSHWLSVVLDCISHGSANFTTVDRAVSLVVALHHASGMEPKVHIDERPTMYKMMTKLLRYLRSDCAAYHVRAVNLIWALEAATKRPHVESILAQTMNSPESRNVQESYEAFGVLWRLTEDNLLPGFRFKVPMMIVLDTLKNDDPSLRRIGETWMRCSLKSYLRVLDPIIFELLDPSIRRIPSTTKMLLSVIRFGGQGFAKTARNTSIKRAQHSGLVQRVQSGGFPEQDVTYMEVLVELLLRFLQSEPSVPWAPAMRPQNAVIHSTTVELLQTIVARGEIELAVVESIEAIVVGKLYYCIHTNRLDLQNKLLHLLHSVISASTADDLVRPFAGKHRQGERPPETLTTFDSTQEIQPRAYAVNPLLIQTLMDGISVPANRPVLQHWLDFVLMAVPQFQPALHAVVAPLNECICRQLQTSLDNVLKASSHDDTFSDDTGSTITDAEFIMLLNGLERLVLLSLAYTSEPQSPEEDQSGVEKSAESGGLFGYVSTVFSSENTLQNVDEQLTVRSQGYRSLRDSVQVLYSIWGLLCWTDPEIRAPKDESTSLIYNRVRLRSRRVLEHLFRVQSSEVFEAIVDCWNRDTGITVATSNSAFELTDVLIANAQSAVQMICDSISGRISGLLEKTRKQTMNPELTDGVLFKFLEQYLQRLEGPLAVQVWGRFLQLTKEVIGGGKDYRLQSFPTLRCLTVLADKLTQTTAIEDRRIRKDLQETFGKLLDSCVVYVGRSFDQGSWIRRTTKEALTTNGRESPAPRNEAKIDEKFNSSSTSLTPETPKPASNEVMIQINDFIAKTILPNLRRFLVDNDKVAAACSNIVYYIVNPAMKGKAKPMEVDATTVSILHQMSRLPAALKAWRAPIAELLNDNRVFNSTAEAAELWKPIVKALFDVDKTAFPELLGKVATAPSTNIFTNREYEMLLRSLNLRRLSFVLFTGDKNHFLTQLPSIQEKLVDILRNVSAPNVQSDVYLCIRVLLCRLSPHNLTSFWPVILTELYRLFEQVMSTLPSDGSDDLQLILSVCKFLDLLLVLQTEEFQIHQWIFITDTVDAIYRPNDWYPEAMFDQLAEIVGNLPSNPTSQNGSNVLDTGGASSFSSQRVMRRPLLNGIHQIDSIRDLVPFFSSVSISSYESVYASGGIVDWEAIEKGLMNDMFDGR